MLIRLACRLRLPPHHRRPRSCCCHLHSRAAGCRAGTQPSVAPASCPGKPKARALQCPPSRTGAGVHLCYGIEVTIRLQHLPARHTFHRETRYLARAHKRRVRDNFRGRPAHSGHVCRRPSVGSNISPCDSTSSRARDPKRHEEHGLSCVEVGENSAMPTEAAALRNMPTK